MVRPLRVGLTGGIASGKSTVAARFVELGVPVLDADVSARRVVAPGSDGLNEVLRRFGRSLLRPDGTLDRAALRSMIFADPAARQDLEAILHPRIRADMDAAADAVSDPYLVMAVPLLIESGSARARVDRILVVDIPEEAQIARLLQRDGGGRQQAHAILATQAERSTRLGAADDVLDNSGDVAALRDGVDALHRKYLQLAGQASTRPY